VSSVHTPREKKRLAYERDHYAKGKYDKAFRKGWYRKGQYCLSRLFIVQVLQASGADWATATMS